MVRIPQWLLRARNQWTHIGRGRPAFAVEPDAEQESVWDYPRPPRVAPDAREVVVRAGATEIARTARSLRVLETASPPTFYLPRDDVRMELLEPSGGGSVCEWKGTARYWDVVLSEQRLVRAGWSYESPFDEMRAIAGYLSFYPSQLVCVVDGVIAKPQPGEFYGGWITPEVVGPFKGEPGSSGW